MTGEQSRKVPLEEVGLQVAAAMKPSNPELHEFRLYRSGWSDDLPWDDNQLWASGVRFLAPAVDNMVTLDPMYGHSATWYQVFLRPDECAEVGWTTWKVRLVIDSSQIGYPADYPLTWYRGCPSDWPSGLVRFPEGHGPQTLKIRNTFPEHQGGPRGVWTLAVRRAS